MRRLAVWLVVLGLATSLSGCRLDAATSKVFATRDGRVVLEPAPDSKGETIFRIENNFPGKRRMVLLHLDEGQDPAALQVGSDDTLPVGKPADLEYRGQGYRVVEKLDAMRPFYGGDQRPVSTIHTYLREGTYVLLSNLPGDYGRGVWRSFVVGASS